MAMKSINDSVGLDKIVPSLSVFNALPKLWLTMDVPTSSPRKRALALGKAVIAISRHTASKLSCDALKTRNDPTVTEIHKTSIGYPVLKYRSEEDKWKDRFSLLYISKEDITILTTKGAQMFCSTVVKLYVTENEVIDTRSHSIYNTQMNMAPSLYQKQPLTNVNQFLMTSNGNRFENSQMAGFNDLLDRRVLKLVWGSEAAELRIYIFRLFDTINHKWTSQPFE